MLLLLLLFVIKLVVIKKIRSKCMYEGVVQHADAYIYICRVCMYTKLYMYIVHSK